MLDNLNSDVSTEGTDAYFRERDPNLASAVRSMESVETWTQDRYDEVQFTLQQFADGIDSADISEISEQLQVKLIVLLGYISSGKAIKLLMWIEQSLPNFVARTLAEAQMLGVLDKVNEDASRLFVERFYVLERLHMLSRVFSDDRLRIVQKVLRILSGEDATDNDEQIDEDN
jgi:intracellular multiplication protein IcmW